MNCDSDVEVVLYPAALFEHMILAMGILDGRFGVSRSKPMLVVTASLPLKAVNAQDKRTFGTHPQRDSAQ